MEILREIEDAFVARGVGKCCVAASALAARHLSGTRVVFGFAIFQLPGEAEPTAFRHAWVQLPDGQAYDIASEINLRLLGTRLGYTLKEEGTCTAHDLKHRLDRETPEERAESDATEKIIGAYLRRPKDFWKCAPGWMRRWAPGRTKTH